MAIQKTFTEADMKSFEPAEKVGIVATVDSRGLPHMSLLTSLMASRPDQLTIGEFSTGKSKEYMALTKNMAFAILTMDRVLWRGRGSLDPLQERGA